MLRAIKKNWFLAGVVVAIILAKWKPYVGAKGGPLKPEITVKYFAVSLIFLASGLSLETKDLRKALLQVNIHIFVQSFTFIFFPLFIHVVVRVLQHTSYNKHLLDGLTVLSCMPPPVSSAVILTKATGGNEAAAIFNSAFGSFLGIFVTPALLLATHVDK
ncbi:sodium/bile acid cotransporter 7-B-like isoform X2 [Pomacea canaliculata]|uniref:sodium/bile acid cotransporter 7-B-like isoform X2 n=1 Tax=Pomacea canaliculata TaxID=400727 RepID=UPI000D7365A1|nr:sodium/bile acid cotransporter 7-B-like isoform X2 [Pomacea canaliculata]XP_025086969.1 sodium/bile acid cotransporter 7-B-like isoform X2 [Pomacea canaliculata]XP_025086970.1 sodium/bile acid cotransporter 7-B-like isoform X2 [Pomacea canaliculata]